MSADRHAQLVCHHMILVGLLVLTVALSPPSAAGIEMPGPREKWVRLQLGEVTVLSNARPGATLDLARSLEFMRSALGKATRLPVSSSLPLTILVFDDEKDYQRYADAVFDHTGKESTGVFLDHPTGGVIAIAYTGRSAGTQILYHELTHRFLADSAPGAPLWLGEGLAELYSTFSRSGDKINIGIPRVDHIRTLRAFPVVPLSTLFAVTHQSPEYNESDRATVFYAESWAFAHYLLIGSHERAGQLSAFFGSLAAGRDTESAFRHAFSSDYAALEGELRAYVNRKILPYLTFDIGELSTAPLPEPVAATGDEVLVELGGFLSKISPREFGNALSLLREAARVNPTNADAWAMIAAIEEQQGSSPEATADFEKALEVGSGSFRAHSLYAQAILTRKQGFVVPADAPPNDVLRARELFARSVELKPGDALAWAGLGSTYLFQQRDLEPGIAALEKSLSLAPSQVDATYNLVLLYAATGQAAKASPLVAGVLARSANPELAEQARRILAQWPAATTRASSLPQSPATDHPIDAIAQPGTAHPGRTPRPAPTPDPEVVQAFKDYQQRARQQEQELALYRAFADKVNADDYEGAVAAADEYLRIAKIDELIATVKDVRRQLVERLAKRKR
jgi:tetratricopeptide (TPR) repeat protein